MLQLYKSRDFSAYFQDTFTFVKQHGAHFFKQFFIVNGIFILILMVIGYFFMDLYTELVFSGIGSNNPSVIDDFINENSLLFMLLFLLFLLASLVFGVLMYAFPIFYMELYQKHSGTGFGSSELIEAYKGNIGKLLIYILASILIGIPLVLVIGIMIFVLFITIIGILMIPFALAIISLFYYMALFEYIRDERGIWDSYSYSWKLLSSKLVAAVGSVGLFYLMSYVIQNVVTVIAYIFGILRMFTTTESGSPNPDEISSSFSVIMVLTFVASFLLGAILNNIVLLNQGIVYYSLKEENESINTKSIIDQIGSGE